MNNTILKNTRTNLKIKSKILHRVHMVFITSLTSKTGQLPNHIEIRN